MVQPIVTLTTDFGTQDGYVGAMTGVILCQKPNALVVTISHDVPPQDVRAGAWALGNAWSWFPSETIHVVVVDPGVGSERKPILVQAAGHLFIGPDNGVIPAAIGPAPTHVGAYEITNPEARASRPSATFHGRDIFAWAAGWIAAGNHCSHVGPSLRWSDLVRLPDTGAQVRREGGRTVLVGKVTVADRFGNLVTTIPNRLVEETFGAAPPVAFVADRRVIFGRTFSDAPPGETVVYPGSSGLVEAAINGESAEAAFGTAVAVRLTTARS